MAATSEEKASADKKTLAEKFKLFAAIVGIVSPILALATFIGFKPEKAKSLEWEYQSKSSLVNTSAASSDKIEVFYDGRKIKQLSAISARLVNSGGLSIDSSDVKDGAFPTVIFPASVTVIGAQVTKLTPTDLKATISYSTNFVRIEHGLLNPTDNIELQILLEGDAGEIKAFPQVSYRISGITTAKTLFPSEPLRPIGVAYFNLPLFTDYLALILASLPVIVCFFIIWVPCQEAFMSVFPEKKMVKRYSETISLSEWPIYKLKSAKELQDFLAERLVISGTPKEKVKDLVLRFEVQNSETKQQFSERLREKLLDELTPKSLFARIRVIDKGAVMVAIAFTAIGLSGALVLFASWFRLITGR